LIRTPQAVVFRSTACGFFTKRVHEDASQMKEQFLTIDGNQAAEYVAYRTNEVIAASKG